MNDMKKGQWELLRCMHDHIGICADEVTNPDRIAEMDDWCIGVRWNYSGDRVGALIIIEGDKVDLEKVMKLQAENKGLKQQIASIQEAIEMIQEVNSKEVSQLQAENKELKQQIASMHAAGNVAVQEALKQFAKDNGIE